MFTNELLKIEETLTVSGKTYHLLAALMCDGSHTTCYFQHTDALYCYDGMLNGGMATLAGETLNSSAHKKHYDHLVYICQVSGKFCS